MGNNAAYTAWEAAIIALANVGALTLADLDTVSAPYRGFAIDRGGRRGLTTHTGLDDAMLCLTTVFLGDRAWCAAHWGPRGPQTLRDLDRLDATDVADLFATIRQDRWGWI